MALGNHNLGDIRDLGRLFFAPTLLIKIDKAHYAHSDPGNQCDTGLPKQTDDGAVGDLEQIESTQRSVIKFKKLFNKPNNKKKNSVKNKKNKEI